MNSVAGASVSPSGSQKAQMQSQPEIPAGVTGLLWRVATWWRSPPLNHATLQQRMGINLMRLRCYLPIDEMKEQENIQASGAKLG
jgi:hypothetical protein